jgi:predicted nucleic acid-binding Zn ribbon protein
MKFTDAELAYARSKGLYVTEKCDACGKVLNQSYRYTAPVRPETWCSAACRDNAMGWSEAKHAAKARRCVVCKAEIPAIRRQDSTTCSTACKNRLNYQNRKKAVA